MKHIWVEIDVSQKNRGDAKDMWSSSRRIADWRTFVYSNLNRRGFSRYDQQDEAIIANNNVTSSINSIQGPATMIGPGDSAVGSGFFHRVF